MARDSVTAARKLSGASPSRLGREGLARSEREEIAGVAYGLFERRGGGHGNDQQDWFEAERIVRQRRRGTNGR